MGVHNCQQLKNVWWVVSLCRRKLAALVGPRVRPSLIVRLRQDRRDGELARVCRQHPRRAGSKVCSTGAEERASFSASMFAFASGST